MKAAQIKKYAKKSRVTVEQVPVPKITPTEVLIKVTYAAVNPLEELITSGSVRLIQSYDFPLTLGNELSGIIVAKGSDVKDFEIGDAVYTRLPLQKIGAFAEFVATAATAVAKVSRNLDMAQAAAIPLTGLTAYQIFHEILTVSAGETVFIPGGSGSFGQMAIPIAKLLGLNVIVSGNSSAEKRSLEAGADRYFDYRTTNYWEVLSDVDYVIDTLGTSELEHELSIMKPTGALVSLRMGPNQAFAESQSLPFWKKAIFKLAGSAIDRKAKKANVTYHFVFVHADGAALKQITDLVEHNGIVPAIDPRIFTLDQVTDALALMSTGHLSGKVLIAMDA